MLFKKCSVYSFIVKCQLVKNTNIDLIEKLNAIKEIKFMSQRDVAAKFGIGVGAVNYKVKIIKLESICENNPSPSIKQYRSLTSTMLMIFFGNGL